MKRISALLLAVLLVLSACAAPPEPEITPSPGPEVHKGGYTPLNYEDMKAIWLSQFDLSGIYTDSGGQREEEDFRARMEQVLENVAAAGFNTVMVQVRPNGDSMYPSEYYPMSAYAVGAYGNEAEYDPFAIIVELAHAKDLSVHGWINPMRCMREGEIMSVPDEYLLKQWYLDEGKKGYYLVPVNGVYWLNIAYEQVRELIVNGARELVTVYDLDGLHMDDYFYPTTGEEFDAAAYLQAGGSLAAFRRDNLNLLVSGLYEAVKRVDSDILFGISPAGNLRTVYESQYADVYTWCAEPGYIDYICPQVYFGLEHENFAFDKVCQTWEDIVTCTDVDLIIGMTLGKAYTGTDDYAGSGKNEWQEHRDVLARSLSHTLELEKCRGVSVFCYQYFHHPLTGEPVKETAEEVKNFLPLLKEITWN